MSPSTIEWNDDLFHEDVPFGFIRQVFEVMAEAEQHTFQVLTKRPERMLAFFDHAADYMGLVRADLRGWPNVRLGVSVEDQATADERIPLLLDTPAAVRFVSYEPALGSVNFRAISLGVHRTQSLGDRLIEWDALSGTETQYHGPTRTTYRDTRTGQHPRLDWIIVGGESGPGARPFDLAWARSVIEQGRAAGVPVFVKQLGSDPRSDSWDDIVPLATLRSPAGRDPDEWPADLRVREFPEVAR